MNRRDFLKLIGLGALVAPVVKAAAEKPVTAMTIDRAKYFNFAVDDADLLVSSDTIEQAQQALAEAQYKLYAPTFNPDWYRDNWVPNIATTRFTDKKGGVKCG